LIMQLLRDNLTLWTSDIPEDGGKILKRLPHTHARISFHHFFPSIKLLLIGANHGYQNLKICMIRVLI